MYKVDQSYSSPDSWSMSKIFKILKNRSSLFPIKNWPKDFYHFSTIAFTAPPRLNKHFFSISLSSFKSLLTITQDGSSAYFNNIPVLIATHSLVMLLLLLLSLPLLLCMTKDYSKFTVVESAQKLIWVEKSSHSIIYATTRLKCYKLKHSLNFENSY